MKNNNLNKFYIFAILFIVGAVLFPGISTLITGDNDSKKETKSTTSTSSSFNSKEDDKLSYATTESLVGLTADYDGSTEEGTVLNKWNKGITVFAEYDNGNKLDITDYIIENPATLKAGKTSTIIITYENVQCKLRVKCTSLTAKQYKGKCKHIPYKKLARTPKKYKGKKVKFTGKIVQVMEDEDGLYTVYRINVTKGRYGLWDDTVYVEYWEDSEKRLLEDDIVTFYGESEGLHTYNTILGASVTIPSVDAKYITLNK